MEQLTEFETYWVHEIGKFIFQTFHFSQNGPAHSVNTTIQLYFIPYFAIKMRLDFRSESAYVYDQI